jgi:hypothetical protein
MLRSSREESQAVPRRRIDRPATQAALLALVRSGQTIAAACAAVGIDPATCYRWTDASLTFAFALAKARDAARDDLALQDDIRKACGVPVHPNCPRCGRESEEALTHLRMRFWRCSTWPTCRCACWLPRHTQDCSACGGPMYWSCSRRTVGCERCKVRRRVRRSYSWREL